MRFIRYNSYTSIYNQNLSLFSNKSLEQVWRNFFKEAFLFDFLYKIWFINFSLDYLIKGAFYFNFRYLNDFQLLFLYKVNLLLNGVFFNDVSLGFFLNWFFKVLLWVLVVSFALILL